MTRSMGRTIREVVRSLLRLRCTLDELVGAITALIVALAAAIVLVRDSAVTGSIIVNDRVPEAASDVASDTPPQPQREAAHTKRGARCTRSNCCSPPKCRERGATKVQKCRPPQPKCRCSGAPPRGCTKTRPSSRGARCAKRAEPC